jgi:hypothetical protein
LENLIAPRAESDANSGFGGPPGDHICEYTVKAGGSQNQPNHGK